MRCKFPWSCDLETGSRESHVCQELGWLALALGKLKWKEEKHMRRLLIGLVGSLALLAMGCGAPQQPEPEESFSGKIMDSS